MVRPAELSVVALEQVMGIEPTRSAWEAEVLPLNYTCKWLSTVLLIHILSKSGENVNIHTHFYLQMKERNPRSVSALFHQLFQLVLDALERVVDALDMAAEHLRDFLIALAVQIRRQNPAFQRGKRLVDAAFNAHIAFPADEQFFRIGASALGDDVQQRAVALFFINRLVERHIGIERNMIWRVTQISANA